MNIAIMRAFIAIRKLTLQQMALSTKRNKRIYWRTRYTA